MKRLSHFLLFHKTGQFLAFFLAFLPQLCALTCSLAACFTAQAMSRVASAAEILNPATTGPYGAAYPYGYYSELPPNPPAPDSSGNTLNSVNTSETPAADNNQGSQSQAASADTKPPEAMPEPNPEAKATGGDEEKLNPEQKALLEAARKKVEKGDKEEKREKPETGKEELAGQSPELLPESPARTVLKEMKQGLYAKALADLENLKRLNPQAYELDYLSAVNHIMLKQPAQARVYYEKILHSQAPDTLKQLAQIGLRKLHSQSRR